MGEQNQIDHSVWNTFFNEHVVYMSDAMLKQIIQDVIKELSVDRKLEENENE